MRHIGVLILILVATAIDAAQPRIELVKRRDVFVEDKETSFVCHPDYLTKQTRIAWMIVEDTTGPVKALDHQLPFRKVSSYRKVNANGTDVFTVSMRRDFSNKFLTCMLFEVPLTRYSVRKVFYRIPKIAATIPIDKVILRGHNVALGSVLRFYCDVKSRIPVRQVYIKSDRLFTPAHRHWKLTNNDGQWTRYEIVSRTKTTAHKQHNGKRWQCVAETENVRSNKGNVLSKLETLVVHYLEFLSSEDFEAAAPTVSVRQDKRTAVLRFKIRANPKPSDGSFSLTESSFPDVAIPIVWVHVQESTEQDGYDRIFEVLIVCRLQRSGKYILRYKTPYIEAKSSSFDIKGISGNKKSNERVRPTEQVQSTVTVPHGIASVSLSTPTPSTSQVEYPSATHSTLADVSPKIDTKYSAFKNGRPAVIGIGILVLVGLVLVVCIMWVLLLHRRHMQIKSNISNEDDPKKALNV